MQRFKTRLNVGLLSLTAAFFFLLALQPAQAATNPIAVTQAWAHATPPGAAIGAAYLDIANSGAKADTLVGAQSVVATSASVHEMKMADGMMQMRAVPALAVPAHGKVQLSPQGYHVMLNGLKAPLKEGDHFQLTLMFEHSGAVTVDVTIEALGASAMTHQH